MSSKIDCHECMGTGGIERMGHCKRCAGTGKIAAAVVERQRVAWWNGCNTTVPKALRYLANHERPSGGEQSFNAEHLFQLASEIERMAEMVLYTAPPELAELQVTIADLQAEIERLKAKPVCIYWDEKDNSCSDIERLKGGQREPVAIGAWRKTLSRFHFISRDIDYMRKNYGDCADFALIELSGDVAVLEATYIPTPKPAPVSVVMPERREPTPATPYLTDADHEWNACLDKVKELNQ